jgi:hypothetical protein
MPRSWRVRLLVGVALVLPFAVAFLANIVLIPDPVHMGISVEGMVPAGTDPVSQTHTVVCDCGPGWPSYITAGAGAMSVLITMLGKGQKP